MEATDEPFTMSYELMLHSSDAVHSLLGSAQHHNSSAPEPIITAYPFCHASSTSIGRIHTPISRMSVARLVSVTDREYAVIWLVSTN